MDGALVGGNPSPGARHPKADRVMHQTLAGLERDAKNRRVKEQRAARMPSVVTECQQSSGLATFSLTFEPFPCRNIRYKYVRADNPQILSSSESD